MFAPGKLLLVTGSAILLKIYVKSNINISKLSYCHSCIWYSWRLQLESTTTRISGAGSAGIQLRTMALRICMVSWKMMVSTLSTSLDLRRKLQRRAQTGMDADLRTFVFPS